MLKIFERPIYVEKIKPYMRKNIIKVFSGQRRVGKSYILLQIIQQIKKSNPSDNIIFINKEKYEFDDIKNFKDLLKYIEKNTLPNKMNYVFIDEIQEIEYFEKALRDLNDNPIYDIYCTGSNANLLSSELSTFLSGRYIETKVYSLSFNEFLEFHKLPRSEKSFYKYLKYGGMPYLFHLELDESIVFDYLQNIFNSIVLKDVVARHNIRNVNFLERLILFLADNIGNLLSAKKISDFLKSQQITLSINTVMNYINYLEESFFIKKVQRYDLIGKKFFEINEKIFFEDLGLRNNLVGYRQNDIGKILENIVYKHLILNGFNVFIGKLGDSEIDFVAEKRGNYIYIQVSYLLTDQNTINREFGNLLKIKDNFRKIVVSMDKFAEGNIKGVEHLHILDFLNEQF